MLACLTSSTLIGELVKTVGINGVVAIGGVEG
jgi:hypothetical protein